MKKVLNLMWNATKDTGWIYGIGLFSTGSFGVIPVLFAIMAMGFGSLAFVGIVLAFFAATIVVFVYNSQIQDAIYKKHFENYNQAL